jgi:hypothetical protein
MYFEVRFMKISLKAPVDCATVEQLTKNQLKFLEDRKHLEIVAENPDWLNLVRKGEEDSIPEPARFEFDTDGFDADAKFFVLLSENEDMSDAKEVLCENNECEIYNLFLGKQYFWKIVAKLGTKQIAGSETRSFTTSARTPRSIRAGGLSNVRDLGGYTCADGGDHKYEHHVHRTHTYNAAVKESERK